MHEGMPYGRNQGQGQGHSREVDRQSPTGLIFFILEIILVRSDVSLTLEVIISVSVSVSLTDTSLRCCPLVEH